MREKDQIADLFKDAFNNYEANVRPELWQQVAAKIQTPPSPVVPDGSAVAQVATAASKISGGMIAWVGVAALVVSVATGYYLYNSGETIITDKKSTEEQIAGENIVSELPAQSEESAAQPIVSDPSKTERTKENVQSTVSKNNPDMSSPVVVSEPIKPVETGNHSNKTTGQQEITTTSSVKKEVISNNSSQIPATPLTGNENTSAKPKIHAFPLSGYAPLEVNFTATNSGNGNEWNFGDGTEQIRSAQVTHSFSAPGTYLVTYRNTDEHGKIVTELLKIEVLSDLTIDNIPNIFTPNGDGVNDFFEIITNKDIDIEVSIFDRTGKFIYKFDGVENNWNGKINNLQDAEEGTYFYVIFASGKNGAKNTQKGTITLKR